MKLRVSFAEAVAHFVRLGFTVTPGPRMGEVTLTRREEDYETTIVWPTDQLQPIAQISQAFRFRNALVRMGEAG